MPTGSLAERILLEVHNRKSLRYDARQIASLMDISQSDLAKIIGERYDSLRRRPDSESYQQKLAPIAAILTELRHNLGSDKLVRVWLRAANPDLGGRRPLDELFAGHIKALRSYVYAATSGQGI